MLHESNGVRATANSQIGLEVFIRRRALWFDESPVVGGDDVEIAAQAALLRERNALDARIGRLLDRPVNTGSLGE